MRAAHWISLFLLATAVSAHGASFSCARARRPIERAICSNPQLSADDTRMAEAYRASLSRLTSNSIGLLRVDQVQWLAYVQQVCRVEDATVTRSAAAACLQPFYRQRVRQLQAAVGVRDGLAFLTRTQYLAEPEDATGNDRPRGEHPGFGTLQASWPTADTDAETWIAWSAAVEAHMLKTAGAGQPQEMADGTKRTLPSAWDDSMAVGADTTITGVLKNIEHGRVTTILTSYGMGHGAAHGFDTVETLTWLLDQKRSLRAEDVFAASDWKSQLSKMVWADLNTRNQKTKFLYDEVNGPDAKAIQDVLADVTNWTLEPDGLHLSYPDYTIAPRYVKPDDTVLPWGNLKPLLQKNFVLP